MKKSLLPLAAAVLVSACGAPAPYYDRYYYYDNWPYPFDGPGYYRQEDGRHFRYDHRRDIDRGNLPPGRNPEHHEESGPRRAGNPHFNGHEGSSGHRSSR